jgi:hypothetical protein
MYLKNFIKHSGKFFEIAFLCLSVIYAFLSGYYFLTLPGGSVDEIVFLNDLNLIETKGWYAAISKNISIPHLGLVYPLSILTGKVIALRLVNVILLLLLLFYFYFRKLSKIGFIFLIFYISTVGYFYSGTNDTLFVFSLVVFLNEIRRAANKESYSVNLALISLLIAVFTRELYLVYLPVILVGLFIMVKVGINLNKRSWIPLVLLAMFLFCNLPTLVSNGNLSYDRKLPPEEVHATWTQRQYLAQIMVNNGELPNYYHPSWEQTDEYLKINGDKSLPDGILQGLFFDVSFTLKEFVKDLVHVFIYSSRGLGFILLICLGYLFLEILKNRSISLNLFSPGAALIMLIIFSLIIISYVEMRWLSPIFILLIAYYSDLTRANKIHYFLKNINLFFFCILAGYGVFKILNRIY